MNIIQAIFLGLLQGATEFLPISSSGHLVLVPWLLGWPRGSLTFDVVVHLGTLVAVVIYFRQDIRLIVQGVFNTLRERSLDDIHGRLGWLILVGSIPAAFLGVFWGTLFENLFSAPLLVSFFLLLTGLVLLLSERMSQHLRDVDNIGVKDSLLIGLAQAAAITPGISRSGATIAAGLALKINRQDAARFSFLLALPIILGAGGLKLKEALEYGIRGNEVMILVSGFVVAAISGYICIHFLLSYIRRYSLYLFVAYCWLFGIFCMIVAFVRG